MKNYFLFALILIISIYSVNALYQGTLNVGVGESPNVEIGDIPIVVVTEGDGGGSSSGGSSGGGGGGSSGSSESFVEVFNQTLEINEDGEIVESQTNTNIEQTSGVFSPITGAIIGIAKKPITLLSMSFLVLILVLTLIIVKGKK